MFSIRKNKYKLGIEIMANIIRKFQTISKYRAPLRQSPVVISGMVNILNYINDVINDDTAHLLNVLIEQHVTRKGLSAHYLNIDLLRSQIIPALHDAFIRLSANSAHLSDNTTPLVPNDESEFLAWLVLNQKIYIDTIPVDYDALGHGITLGIFQNWLSIKHDQQLDVHDNTITIQLNKVFTFCEALAFFRLNHFYFNHATFNIIDDRSAFKLHNILVQQLVADGLPLSIDFLSHPDKILSAPLVGMKLITDVDVTNDVTLVNYAEFLSDFGETDNLLIDKKYLDYYDNQLNLVNDSTLDQSYNDVIKTIRNKVTVNYSKAFNVFTVLNKTGFGVNLAGYVDHLAMDKTLDLINIVGLSKSIVCLCLVPYPDAANNVTNKLVISFDNYNPLFTKILIDDIIGDGPVFFKIAISVSPDVFSVYVGINDKYTATHFDTTNRRYHIDPLFLFVVPRVDNFKRGTIRLTDVKLYGQALTDDDSLSLIEDLHIE